MTDLDRLKELYPLSSDVTIQSSTGNATDCHSDRVEASSGTPVRRNARNELHESEEDLQKKAIDYLHLKGWHVAHFRPARVEKNGKVTWRTAVSADGQGLIMMVVVLIPLPMKKTYNAHRIVVSLMEERVLADWRPMKNWYWPGC